MDKLQVIPYTNDVYHCQLQVVLSIYNLEAQAILSKKLRKRVKQQKQVCKFIGNTNLLLEKEIKFDEHKKQSLLIALDSLKARNVQLKKDLLLAKDKRQSDIDIVNNTIKKYEEKWLQCQKRFENIHFIQRYICTNKENETLTQNIENLIKQSKEICVNISLKKLELQNLDTKLIIDLADFLINKRPVILNFITNNNNELQKLENEKKKIADFQPGTYKLSTLGSTNVIKKNRLYKGKTQDLDINNDKITKMFPKLQLHNIDIVPVEFDESVQITASVKRYIDNSFTVDLDNFSVKKAKVQRAGEVISSNYSTPTLENNTSKDLKERAEEIRKRYSDKKLIHILEDKQLNPTETYGIITKLKTNHFQETSVIKYNIPQADEMNNNLSQDKLNNLAETNNIAKGNPEDILVPPTQFLDPTQNSQEKRVKFSDVVTIQEPSDLENEVTQLTDEAVMNDSTNQINASADSNDSYKDIKKYVFEKHNLNASPEFTYKKNSIAILKGNSSTANTTTSKYFNEILKDSIISTKEHVEEIDRDDDSKKPKFIDTQNIEHKTQTMGDLNEGPEILKAETSLPESGHVFKSYLQTLTDPLNISMNTTGYDDTETDFPQCIDSSLLLSPKADMEMQTENRPETFSQDVPSFLAGLRKTGFSIFGTAASDNNPESETKNTTNQFNFTFGGDGNKRGGLFNLFH